MFLSHFFIESCNDLVRTHGGAGELLVHQREDHTDFLVCLFCF